MKRQVVKKKKKADKSGILKVCCRLSVLVNEPSAGVVVVLVWSVRGSLEEKQEAG